MENAEVQDHIIADHKRSKINATQSPKLRKAYNFQAKRGWSEPGLQWSCRRSESTSPAVGGREPGGRESRGGKEALGFVLLLLVVDDLDQPRTSDTIGLTTGKFWSYREHLWLVQTVGSVLYSEPTKPNSYIEYFASRKFPTTLKPNLVRGQIGLTICLFGFLSFKTHFETWI